MKKSELEAFQETIEKMIGRQMEFSDFCRVVADEILDSDGLAWPGFDLCWMSLGFWSNHEMSAVYEAIQREYHPLEFAALMHQEDGLSKVKDRIFGPDRLRAIPTGL